MSDAVIVKPVTKSFNAAQSIWKMYLPVFITDVKDSLRPCDSPKVKAKFANAQRKMLTAWLTLMTDPKHMKTDHDVSSLNNPNFGLLRNLARISGFFCTAKFSLRIRNISPKYRQNCFYR